MGVLRPFRRILGTLEGIYRVYSRCIRIPGLRAQNRGPWFQPWSSIANNGAVKRLLGYIYIYMYMYGICGFYSPSNQIRYQVPRSE